MENTDKELKAAINKRLDTIDAINSILNINYVIESVRDSQFGNNAIRVKKFHNNQKITRAGGVGYNKYDFALAQFMSTIVNIYNKDAAYDVYEKLASGTSLDYMFKQLKIDDLFKVEILEDKQNKKSFLTRFRIVKA